MGFTLQLLEEKGYTGAQFMKDLGWVVVAIVSIAGAFMTVYAIYIAYLFATATDANKRKAAKDRLMKTELFFPIQNPQTGFTEGSTREIQ